MSVAPRGRCGPLGAEAGGRRKSRNFAENFPEQRVGLGGSASGMELTSERDSGIAPSGIGCNPQPRGDGEGGGVAEAGDERDLNATKVGVAGCEPSKGGARVAGGTDEGKSGGGVGICQRIAECLKKTSLTED
jgi:hypothetical protein